MHRGRWETGYSEGELDDWATRIRTFLGQGVDAYVYFNNDPEGHAIRDAERLGQMLGIERKDLRPSGDLTDTGYEQSGGM